MSIKNYAYFSTSTGYIENTLSIDDAVAPTLIWETGFQIVEIPECLMGEWSACGIGWSYINGQFVEPPAPPPPEQPATTGTTEL